MVSQLSLSSLVVGSQVLLPAVALVAVGLPALVGRPLAERVTTRLVGAGFAAAFLAAVATFVVLAVRSFAPEVVHLGQMFGVGHHEATIELVADGLSIPYVCFSTALCWIVNVFASRYLHREPGFTRFFVLLALFGMGMNMMVLAGSIDVLFAGWEFVGISSALLIGFFHERRNAVDAAVRAFVTYRICDMGLLAASVVLHAAVGSGDFSRMFSGGWPGAVSMLTGPTPLIVSLLIVLAALGKSAQVPFSGWLPQAMEGPTPSSAIFYGALSIHAGAYLLMRCQPLLDAAPAAGWLLVTIGLGTAVHAVVVGWVQTDIKSMLAYASMTQAGLILAEIGFGFRVLPLVHVVSHAILRSLQILRSPSALRDRDELATALGGHPGGGRRSLPGWLTRRLYGVALARGFEDSVVQRMVTGPVVAVLEAARDAEARWVTMLARVGEGSRPNARDREGGLR